MLRTAKKPDELGCIALQVAAVRLGLEVFMLSLGILALGCRMGYWHAEAKKGCWACLRSHRKLAGGQGLDSLSPQSHYSAWSRKPNLHSNDPCQSPLSQCRGGWPGEHQPALEQPRQCSGCFGCCCLPHLEPPWCLGLGASVVPTVFNSAL